MLAQRSIHAGGGILITHTLRLQGADSGHRHIRAGLHLPQRLRGNHHPFGPCLFIRHCVRNHLRRVKTPLGQGLAHRHVPGQQMLRVEDVTLHLLAHLRHISVGKRGIHGRNLELRVAGLFRPDAFLGFLPCLHKGSQRKMLAQRSIHAGGGILITHTLRLQGADSGHRHIRAGLHLPQRLRGNHHPFGPCLFIRHCVRNHLRRVKTPLGQGLAHRHVPGQQMLRVEDVTLHLLAHKRL